MLKKPHIFANLIAWTMLFVTLNCLATDNPSHANEFQSAKENPNSYIHATIPAKDLQKMAMVIAEIKRFYVKPVTDQEIIDNAISGMLNGLDPHSEYLKQEDLDSLETLTVGRFGGIGIEVVPDQGLIKIISPLDDTPAAKAGIKAGDVIVQIDNKLVKDLQLHEAIKLMRGPKGSKLKLTILRKNVGKPLVFNLHRDIIKIQSVKKQMLEPGFGYLRVAFFQEGTGNDVIRDVNLLKRQASNNLKGLIIDLRNNPGGLLDAAVQVSDSFLDARKLGRNNIIVYTKGNTESAHITARATPGELLPNIPIVILINEGSASAAEVVAGALQDYKRAIIVGTRSFGKGSVQTLLPVDNTSAIKLTTALYYTPLGRSIQAKGIIPDIVINDIKLPTKTSDDNDDLTNININESSLLDHLQNGNEALPNNKANSSNTSTPTEPPSATNQTEDNDNVVTQLANITQNNKLDLAHKDYQLYESLNILKALVASR